MPRQIVSCLQLFTICHVLRYLLFYFSAHKINVAPLPSYNDHFTNLYSLFSLRIRMSDENPFQCKHPKCGRVSFFFFFFHNFRKISFFKYIFLKDFVMKGQSGKKISISYMFIIILSMLISWFYWLSSNPDESMKPLFNFQRIYNLWYRATDLTQNVMQYISVYSIMQYH